MVQVKVKNLSLVPTDISNNKVYIVGVEFPERLMTNYGIDLVFTEEMQGTSEIITADLSILQEFFFLLSIFLKTGYN